MLRRDRAEGNSTAFIHSFIQHVHHTIIFFAVFSDCTLLEYSYVGMSLEKYYELHEKSEIVRVVRVVGVQYSCLLQSLGVIGLGQLAT